LLFEAILLFNEALKHIGEDLSRVLNDGRL
jgi:hypothetical protein